MSGNLASAVKSSAVVEDAAETAPFEAKDEATPQVQNDTSAPQTKPTASTGTATPGGRKRAIALILVPLAAVAALWYGYSWWTVGRFIETTDDAYIGADNTTLSAKISGYVVAVDAADNSPVKAGQVIARIDAGDYRLAVQAAKDNIASQRATIERFSRQISAQDAAVEQAKAQLTSAEAGSLRTELELKRQKDLATRDFASKQALEQAQAARDQAVAQVQSAKAAVMAAEANVEVLKAQQLEAQGVLKQLQTALEKAERDLSFAEIRAPFDGVIGNRAVQVGDYVQPGQRLAALVPLSAVYVDANFKETQLRDLRAGQPVEIKVDAVTGRKFEGRVVSFAPASGAVFSLLPPDNATGNFTKVVQRMPVRIQVKLTPDEQGLLRPGMSVVVNVNTKEASGGKSLVSEANAAPASH